MTRTRLLLIGLLVVLANLGPVSALVAGGWHVGVVVSGLVATGVVLLAAWVLPQVRGRTRPELRMVATQDLVAIGDEAALERVHGNDYVVRGEVAELDGNELLLQVVDRRVRVLLDGHAVPAEVGRDVEVRGTMVG